MMDKLISLTMEILTKNVVVHIYSYPHFAIETLVAFVVCIVHCLLIIEINNLCRRTNAKGAANLRLTHHLQLRGVESCSHHTIGPERKLSTTSSFGWIIPINHEESRLMMRHGHRYNDRVDHLLATSPSEYMRKDKESKYRAVGLRSCIHSLSTLLDKALDDDIMLDAVSKETIKKSINAIKENLENPFIGNLYIPSLHRLLNQSVNKKSLRNSLVPHHFVSFSLPGDKIETQEDHKQWKSLQNKESLDDLSDEYNNTSIEVMNAYGRKRTSLCGPVHGIL